MAREILHIAGLEKTTPEFRRELIAVADRQGLDPSYLAAVISFETGHTFDATKANPYSGCVGLIQFCMPSTVGTTRSELLQMSPIEQLEYVEKHYAMVDPKKRVSSLEDHYLAVFAPACIGYPPDAKMPCSAKGGPTWTPPAGGCPTPIAGCKTMGLPRHECAYCQNRGLDLNGDGTITTSEATSKVRALVDDARGRPPIVVDDTPEPPIPPIQPPPFDIVPAGLGVGKFVPLIAGGVLGFWGVMRATKRMRRARQ
jgi:hypothetical protein